MKSRSLLSWSRPIKFQRMTPSHLDQCSICYRSNLEHRAVVAIGAIDKTEPMLLSAVYCLTCVRKMAKVAHEIEPVPPPTSAQLKARKKLLKGVKVSKKEEKRIRSSWKQTNLDEYINSRFPTVVITKKVPA